MVNHRAVGPSLARIGSGPLPSAGVTRPRRYYEPIRHLRSPVLTLTGSPLAWRCRSTPRPQTSLVAHCSCPVRAASTTPVGSPAACLALFAVDGGLPRYRVGSAPTLSFSRPAWCSLALRPARSAVPLTRPFLEVLQTIRRLLIRPECFRLEREFAGLDFHQGEQCALSRHTQHRAREHQGRDHRHLPLDRAEARAALSRRVRVPLQPPLRPCRHAAAPRHSCIADTADALPPAQTG